MYIFRFTAVNHHVGVNERPSLDAGEALGHVHRRKDYVICVAQDAYLQVVADADSLCGGVMDTKYLFHDKYKKYRRYNISLYHTSPYLKHFVVDFFPVQTAVG